MRRVGSYAADAFRVHLHADRPSESRLNALAAEPPTLRLRLAHARRSAERKLVERVGGQAADPTIWHMRRVGSYAADAFRLHMHADRRIESWLNALAAKPPTRQISDNVRVD